MSEHARRHTFLLPMAALLILSLVRAIPAFSAEPREVSLVSLIANPKLYQGRSVRVKGFFHYRFEDCALYLSKDAADYGLLTDAVWIRVGKGGLKQSRDDASIADAHSYDSKMVEIKGIFNMNWRGHMNYYAGSLVSVSHVEELQRKIRRDKGVVEEK